MATATSKKRVFTDTEEYRRYCVDAKFYWELDFIREMWQNVEIYRRKRFDPSDDIYCVQIGDKYYRMSQLPEGVEIHDGEFQVPFDMPTPSVVTMAHKNLFIEICGHIFHKQLMIEPMRDESANELMETDKFNLCRDNKVLRTWQYPLHRNLHKYKIVEWRVYNEDIGRYIQYVFLKVEHTSKQYRLLGVIQHGETFDREAFTKEVKALMRLTVHELFEGDRYTTDSMKEAVYDGIDRLKIQ